jgi:glycosyltransferase involved in cell wall biosynthesis
VYPSLFEGFRMPILEALAAGVATACSRVEPMAGIAAGAALEFDPAATGEIANAIVRLTSDEALRTHLAAAGPARAAQFSWEETVRATLRAIRLAAG